MKEFTVIWEHRWCVGSHWQCLTKKTWVRAKDIHTIMNSDYGQVAIYIFEGFQFTIGETLREEEIVELN